MMREGRKKRSTQPQWAVRIRHGWRLCLQEKQQDYNEILSQNFESAKARLEHAWEEVCPETISENWQPRDMIHACNLSLVLCLLCKSAVEGSNPEICNWLRTTQVRLREYLLKMDEFMLQKIVHMPHKHYLVLMFYLLEQCDETQFETTKYFKDVILDGLTLDGGIDDRWLLRALGTDIDDMQWEMYKVGMLDLYDGLDDGLLCASFAGSKTAVAKLSMKLRSTGQFPGRVSEEQGYAFTHAIFYTFLTGALPTLLVDFRKEDLLADVNDMLELFVGKDIDLAAELVACHWLVGGDWADANMVLYAPLFINGCDVIKNGDREVSAFCSFSFDDYLHLDLARLLGLGLGLLRPGADTARPQLLEAVSQAIAADTHQDFGLEAERLAAEHRLTQRGHQRQRRALDATLAAGRSPALPNLAQSLPPLREVTKHLPRPSLPRPSAAAGDKPRRLADSGCRRLSATTASGEVVADATAGIDADAEAGKSEEVQNCSVPEAICHKCGAPNACKRCGRCRQVTYCSRECQRDDWAAHRRSCGTSSAAVATRVDETDAIAALDRARQMCFAVSQVAWEASVDDEGVLRAAESLDCSAIRANFAAGPALCFPLRFDGLEDEVNFLSVMHLFSFGSGFRNELHSAHGMGANDTVMRGMLGLRLRGISLDARGLAQLSASNVEEAFDIRGKEMKSIPGLPGEMEGEGPLFPYIQNIVRVAQDSSRALSRLGKPSLGRFVLDTLEAVPRSAENLVSGLAHAIPAFSDTGNYHPASQQLPRSAGGPARAAVIEAAFFKKAQALVVDLWRRFGPLGEEHHEHFGFQDLAKLTACADNVVPTTLCQLGAIRVAEPIADAIGKGEPLPRSAEVALRAAALVACERIVGAVQDAGEEMMACQLDSYLRGSLAKQEDYRKLARHVNKSTIFY